MGTFSRKITLSFGLINESVKLTQAIEKSDAPALKTLCIGQGTEHAATPINSVYTCPSCGPVQDRSTLVKGAESGNGWAVITAEEISEAKKETTGQFKKEISLTAHPVEQVLNTTQSTGKLYYLEPNDGNGGRFAVLRDLIKSSPQYAFTAQYTITSNVAIYVARVEGDAIILEQRQQVSLAPAPQVEAETNEAMLQMAQQLLGGLVTDFDADTYADTYSTKLAEMLDAAAVVEGAETPAGSKVHKRSTDDDLMAALATQLASVKQAS